MNSQEKIVQAIEYIGLNNKKLPKIIKEFKPLEFSVPKNYHENMYKQYRYVDIDNIQILLSPTNRSDNIKDKYTNAAPLLCYLDSKNKANQDKCSIFLNILKNANLEKIAQIEKEQEMLNQRLTFKLSYRNEYLWQIYYSPKTNRYFMLYPTNDNESHALLYLIKKQMEESGGKIFVPIINLGYSQAYLSNEQIDDIGNYLNLIAKDYPQVYELLDKNGHLHIQISGVTKILDNIESNYRVILSTKEQAIEYYKILKAMFILQSKFPNYFNFSTNISKQGTLEFSYHDFEINYSTISKFINNEYKLGIFKLREIVQNISEFETKLETNKIAVEEMEEEFVEKEKQISTFLECKKSFFGKVKYYFKSNKNKEKKQTNKRQVVKNKVYEIEIDEKSKLNYTIDDLLDLYKQIETYETKLKTILMDLNALKLKRKNMKAKIENATAFIEQIEEHKKSIFEFWKYSNKDEVSKLSKSEVENVETTKQMTPIFNLEQDREKFGCDLDKYQRAIFQDEIFDSIYLTTDDKILEVLNKLKTKQLTNEELEELLDSLKKELVESKNINNLSYDIFGGYENDNTKIEMVGNKKVRENPKDKFNILGVSTNMRKSDLLEVLDTVLSNIEYALEKVKLMQDVAVFKALSHGSLNENNINIFNLDSKEELSSAMDDSFKMILYKFNLRTKTNVIALTNAVYYNNDNKTLPLGMDKSVKLIFDISKYNIAEVSKKIIRKVQIEDETNDFSKISIKSITVKEYDLVSRKSKDKDYQEKLREAKENLKTLKDNLEEEQLKQSNDVSQRTIELDTSEVLSFENKSENQNKEPQDKAFEFTFDEISGNSQNITKEKIEQVLSFADFGLGQKDEKHIEEEDKTKQIEDKIDEEEMQEFEELLSFDFDDKEQAEEINEEAKTEQTKQEAEKEKTKEESIEKKSKKKTTKNTNKKVEDKETKNQVKKQDENLEVNQKEKQEVKAKKKTQTTSKKQVEQTKQESKEKAESKEKVENKEKAKKTTKKKTTTKKTKDLPKENPFISSDILNLVVETKGKNKGKVIKKESDENKLDFEVPVRGDLPVSRKRKEHKSTSTKKQKEKVKENE